MGGVGKVRKEWERIRKGADRSKVRGLQRHVSLAGLRLERMNRSPITVIVAALIIVVSMALLFRWHVISSSIGVQRLDRWTGKIQFCGQTNGKVVCVDE